MDDLVDAGEGAVTIWMPVEPEANELLTRSPLALLIAMLLDQQVRSSGPSARR